MVLLTVLLLYLYIMDGFNNLKCTAMLKNIEHVKVVRKIRVSILKIHTK